MSTLSERLRTGVDDPGIFDEAADELDRLAARVAELEYLLQETLQPGAYGLGSTLATRISAALEHKHD